jgi:ribonuclease R
MVHRVLEEILYNKAKPDKHMEKKCKHSSERERAAMEAERAANKYKQVEYMRDFIGEEFDGVISGAAAFGFWVETVEHKCEGMVGIASLAEYDDFRFVDTDYSLVGMRSNRKFRIGDKVRIKVIAANLERRHLDYEWVLTTTIEEGEEIIPTEVQKQIQRPKQKGKAKNKKKKSEE